MKTLKKTLILLFLAILTITFSCSKEEVNSNDEKFNIEQKEDVSKLPPTITLKCPLRVKPTGCGYGFNVFVSNYKTPTVPVTGQFLYYEILTLNGLSIVDSGYIAHGMNTNWVLNPCTKYIFRTYPCKNNFTYYVDVIALTDGCGGVFLC